MDADLVIVGGGPAGLATALFAVDRGLSVTVVERRELPLDKACGEGLMPPGREALQEMGVVLPSSSFAPFSGIRFVDEASCAVARFAGRSGWGIARTELIGAMVSRARERGIRLRYGCAAGRWRLTGKGVVVETEDGPIAGRILVGADGLRSRIRRQAGLEGPRTRMPRFGMRWYLATPPWSPYVEVHWSEGVEAYVTPLGLDRVGMVLLWSGTRAEPREDLFDRFPALDARLTDVSLVGPPRGAGPLRQRVRRRYAERVALVGDAAGYVDALTGEGLTLAFRTAKALIETLARGLSLDHYESAYRRLIRTHHILTELMVFMALRPRIRKTTIRLLAKRPSLFDRLLALNVGRWPGTGLEACG